MRKIRFRLNLIVFVTLVLTSLLVWRAIEERSNFTQVRQELEDSILLRSSLISLVERPYSNSLKNKLQAIRRRLKPKHQKVEVSNIIQAYTSRDINLLRKRIEVFLELENENYERKIAELSASVEKMEKFAILAIITPVFGLIWVLAMVKTSILRSLQRLSRRMMDFLVDRYAFQFSEPEENELGDIQRTFNSLAQRVINTMDELKSLDQAKSEFLSIASHELRTPMTSIKGSLSLLGSGVIGNVDPGCKKLIQIAEVETDRLIRLINDLLDLAKIEAGKLPLSCSWISWNEMIAKTSEGLAGLAHNAGVQIAIDSAPGLEAYMDHDRVQQVLTNLISNAIKFSPKGGTVRVTTGRARTGELLVNIRDQGPGISLEDQELIFQKFRQGSSPENPLVKGTGLGLAIARALVEEHGGSIGVESEPTQGSVFWFTLPKWRDGLTSSEERDVA